MNTTLKVGVVGQDISYSKSQDIFRAIARITGKDIDCEVYSVTPEGLTDLLEQARGGKIAGLSVTIPYKSRVVELLDEPDADAAAIGAVNSVCGRGGRLFGYNTDIGGFVDSLPEYQMSEDSRVMILGCGGAASAILYALYVHLAVRRFTLVGRSPAKLNAFRKRLSGVCSNAEIALSEYGAEGVPEVTDMIVNGTPVGGPNDPDGNPLPVGLDTARVRFYYDLNYNADNRTVAAMRKLGVSAMDGARMLVAQALRSYKLWTGESVNPHAVYEAVFGGRQAQGG